MGEEEFGWTLGVRWVLVNEPFLVNEPSHTFPVGTCCPCPRPCSEIQHFHIPQLPLTTPSHPPKTSC